MKTIQLGRPIEINQETDKLLQSIAEAEGDTLDPKVLKAAIPDSGLFIEFLERHNLKDTPEAKSILRQLGSLGLITAARVGLPTKKKTAKPKKAVNPAFRQLDQLRKTVKALRVRLERETRARKIEARVKSEAQKARTRLASQIAELREQGRKLATDLRSALGDASKRDAARQQAIAKIAEHQGGVREEVCGAAVRVVADDRGVGAQIGGTKEACGRSGASRGRDNSRRRASRGARSGCELGTAPRSPAAGNCGQRI